MHKRFDIIRGLNMNAWNAQCLVGALVAVTLPLGAAVLVHPLSAHGAAAAAGSLRTPTVSRREYLARLVAETAARAAADEAQKASRHLPSIVLSDADPGADDIAGKARPD